MKLVLLAFNVIHDDAIRAILVRLRVPGFTEVPRVFGSGESGKRFGTHAFPGHNTMLLAVLPDDQVEPLLAEIAAFKAGLAEKAKRHGGHGEIRAFVLNVERTV